ncbi:RT0821/Lpp0805 family surface protein [Rickettsiales bacterium]|nr:RT0821/Lpp0805 family surface protein [Rickettsiales bacterium]
MTSTIFLISSCQTREDGALRKEDMGTFLGAIGGAVVGSQFGKGKGQLVGTALGTLAGAAVGRSIGSSLDKADMAYHQRTSQQALENNRTGTSMSWKNPDTGHSGSVTPTRTYQTSSGSHCREYTQTINVDGKTEQAYGNACRMPDGTWQITQ